MMELVDLGFVKRGPNLRTLRFDDGRNRASQSWKMLRKAPITPANTLVTTNSGKSMKSNSGWHKTDMILKNRNICAQTNNSLLQKKETSSKANQQLLKRLSNLFKFSGADYRYHVQCKFLE